MRITKETVEHVADLAQLHLTQDEKTQMQLELEYMLNFVEKLVDADVLTPAYVPSQCNVFREDVILPSMDREVLLRNAPHHNKKWYKVPKVIE